MNSMDQIIEGLFLGNIFAPRNASALREANVTHILSITNDSVVIPSTFNPPLIHKKIGVDDYGDENLLRYFQEANAFIDEALTAGRSVLVHCVQGASRSASFVAAYLMQKNGWTRDEAIKFLKDKRAAVNPNAGFMDQLDVYFRAQYQITPESAEYQKWARRVAADYHEKVQAMT